MGLKVFLNLYPDAPGRKTNILYLHSLDLFGAFFCQLPALEKHACLRRQGSLMNKTSKLVLENGIVFTGSSFGFEGETIGEVCFNTGMTGYQEILTDPSYCGQLITMTYPHIGNYGVNPEDVESNKKNIRGTIEKIFDSNDLEKCPTRDQLVDIWFYMVYHLNFERLSLVKSKEKARQHYCHLKHIAKRVLPEHGFALYHMGVLSQIMEEEMDEELVARLQKQLSTSNYWRNRFKEVGISKIISPVWKERLKDFI